VQLSVVIITYNEEANIARTLASVEHLVAEGKGEIIVVDSGSTDRTVEIAKSHGAKVFVEEWKGFAAQKNSAIDKASGDWILSLDADEEVSLTMRDFLQLTSEEESFFLDATHFSAGSFDMAGSIPIQSCVCFHEVMRGSKTAPYMKICS
jgi:glycosyltransferase involved in cell wall biosynthesis